MLPRRGTLNSQLLSWLSELVLSEVEVVETNGYGNFITRIHLKTFNSGLWVDIG
ncbi:MAG: hypothetical protein RMY16_31465 [Nostoc sp. DedQUE12b]|uniref:hypothetical protein n=1 Tax=Nostoc sp. DedQUE12b TaxID=3075398 RepID=UPI002AD56C96|nr:hypothetical protein [Nostoc sp. DedQUE12b]MDZ8089576.1 hypothetical protein [Nostoc sp. DedQUE12b]MDZ8090039.1 hypothetical protein [Nostoc sp. DedQUE12b]